MILFILISDGILQFTQERPKLPGLPQFFFWHERLLFDEILRTGTVEGSFLKNSSTSLDGSVSVSKKNERFRGLFIFDYITRILAILTNQRNERRSTTFRNPMVPPWFRSAKWIDRAWFGCFTEYYIAHMIQSYVNHMSPLMSHCRMIWAGKNWTPLSMNRQISAEPRSEFKRERDLRKEMRAWGRRNSLKTWKFNFVLLLEWVCKRWRCQTIGNKNGSNSSSSGNR
jgi:hypothetical protein